MVAWRLAMESVILAACGLARVEFTNVDSKREQIEVTFLRATTTLNFWRLLGKGAAGAAPDVLLEAKPPKPVLDSLSGASLSRAGCALCRPGALATIIIRFDNSAIYCSCPHCASAHQFLCTAANTLHSGQCSLS